MTRISPRQAREALRDWVPAKRLHFHPDWPGATTSGSFDGHGFLSHWTAMSRRVTVGRQVDVLRHGYPGLPGPLCFASPTRAGDLWVIGWDNTNHAGMGDSEVWQAILASRFDGTPVANDEQVDGNARLWGWECQFHPDDGVFTDEMLEVNILGICAIAEASGWSPKEAAGSCADHYEWAARKWDREVQNLANRTRAGVEAWPKHGGTATTDPLEEIMAWYRDKEDFETSLAKALLTKADLIDVPHGAISEDKRRENPRRNLANSVTGAWQGVVAAIRESKEDQDTRSATRKQARELAERLDQALAALAGLGEQIDVDMTREERTRLANEIASQVDKLRVDVNVVRRDNSEEPTA